MDIPCTPPIPTPLGLVAGALVLAQVSAAHAQAVPGTPYFERRTSGIGYASLTACTTLTTDSDDGQFTVTLPFAFRFYETDETSVRISANGAMNFAGDFISFSNGTLGTSSPDALIAPWWDDLVIAPDNQAQLCHFTEGTAGQRRWTVEWKNVARVSDLTQPFNMKVTLHEGRSGRLDVAYSSIPAGAVSWSATSGIEDQSGARLIFLPPNGNCGRDCADADLRGLERTQITLLQDAGIELVATGIRTPEFAFVGVPASVFVDVTSLHASSIGPVVVAVEASTTPAFENPVLLGTSAPTFIAPFDRATAAVVATVPASFQPGRLYLRAVVDPAQAITETDETNNVVISDAFVRLLAGAADLAVAAVSYAPSAVDAGEPFAVTARLENLGNQPATQVAVRLVLSRNAVISTQDVTIDSATVDLAPGGAVTVNRTSILPDITGGPFYVGVIVDPLDSVVELDEINNARAAAAPVVITGGNPVVTTAELPRGFVGVRYAGLLLASGSGPDAAWSIVQGSLPAGLDLASNGEIFGRPTAAETTTFTAQVTTNGQTATADLSITVVDPDEPFVVATRGIAPAIVGQEFDFPLVSAGGTATATLTWSSGVAPPGLQVRPEGRIAGVPTTAGQFTIALSVTNGVERATRTVDLTVVASSSLLIVPEALASGRFGETYAGQLRASGGLEPYRWRVVDGRLPPGITLNPNGMVGGVPTEVGEFSFRVEVEDSGTPTPANDAETLSLAIVDSGGFEIATENLPFGVVGAAYDQSITARGGQPPFTWTLEEGSVPAGLSGRPDGGGDGASTYRITGEPTMAGTANLLVAVRDSQGRTARRAFALQVFEENPTPRNPSTGCACVRPSRAPKFGVALLVLVIGLCRRRYA